MGSMETPTRTVTLHQQLGIISKSSLLRHYYGDVGQPKVAQDIHTMQARVGSKIAETQYSCVPPYPILRAPYKVSSDLS